MNVAQILKDKGHSVVVDRPDTSIGDVVRHLAAKSIGAIVIVDDDDGVAGIVSERDVMRAIAGHGGSCLERPVGDIMTRDVVSCRAQDSVNDIMGMMTAGRFRHVPVVDDGRLIGLVSIGDVVKNHIAEIELEASALRSYVSG